MTREEFCVLNNAYEASIGRAQSKTDLFLNHALRESSCRSRLVKEGYIDAEGGYLTDAGRNALEPYRVDSAVILAAGSATRFIPLSLEQPKALYEVRGERLIERQILQLQEAGVTDITIVLGYKKDMFAYLEEKYGVRLLFNPAYNVKNNIESLRVARDHIRSSYICACDSYYTENPFHRYEYRSFYTGYSSSSNPEDEFTVHIGADGRIEEMDTGFRSGFVLLGHAFWTKAFTERFFALADADLNVGAYDEMFWECLIRDNLGVLPALYFKEYAERSIFEFDYFDQLRQFDPGYVSHSKSEILRNIKLVFRCDEEDIVDFRTVHEGLTNTSFIFRIADRDYIYRHPGTGTEKIINRRNEKNSLILAKKYGIDPTYIYMDVIEGWKISSFIPSFREPDYASFEDSKKIISVLRKLHAAPITADYGLKPWEDALVMERMLREKDAGCFDKHELLKDKIGKLYRKTLGDGVEKCFCHGDTYRPNWMILPDGEVILIDWEYAGFSDPGIDVGYYIVDAAYDFEEAGRFIREYLGDGWTEQKEFHFMTYTALIAYYWFVWAMYRESCGANMGQAVNCWRSMAEKFADHLLTNQ